MPSKIFTDAFTHKFHRWVMETESFLHDWSIDLDRSRRYADGEHWTGKQKLDLRESEQQDTTLNLVRSSVDAMVNIYHMRSVDFKWVGVDANDDLFSDVLLNLSKQVDRNNEAAFFQAKAAEDGFIGGAGWFELGYGSIPMVADKDIRIYQRDSADMGYEPFSNHPVLNDSRWVYRKIWMDRDEVIDIYPDSKDKLLSEFSDNVFTNIQPSSQELEAGKHRFGYTEVKGGQNRICVIDMEYRPDMTDLNEVRKVVFTGSVFLEGGPEDNENELLNKEGYFLKIPYFSSKDRKGRPLGLVRNLISPQDMINAILSKWEWNVNSKQLDIEIGSVPAGNIAKIEMQNNKRNGIRQWNAGALSKGAVQRRDNLPEASHLISVLDRLISYIDRTWGGNDAVRGQGGTNSRSFAQESQRAELGAGIQTRVLKNFDFTERQIERVKLMLMAKHYKADRVIRVLNESDEVIQNIDLKQFLGRKLFGGGVKEALQYDLVLESTLPFNSVRQEELKAVSQALQAGVFPAPFGGEMLLDLISMPNRRAKKKAYKKAVAPTAN